MAQKENPAGKGGVSGSEVSADSPDPNKTTTPAQRPPKRSRALTPPDEISSLVALDRALRCGPLRKVYGRLSRPEYVVAGRHVAPAIAEKAIRQGRVSPGDGDLFGDLSNSQTFHSQPHHLETRS